MAGELIKFEATPESLILTVRQLLEETQAVALSCRCIGSPPGVSALWQPPRRSHYLARWQQALCRVGRVMAELETSPRGGRVCRGGLVRIMGP